MHLFELYITEKISLTYIKNPLRKEIEDEIINGINQIFYKEKKLDPEARSLAVQHNDLNYIIPQVTEWLKEQLTFRIAASIESAIKTTTGYNVDVKFEQMKVGGHAGANSIHINNEIINKMSHEIVSAKKEHADIVYMPDDDIVSLMFLIYKKSNETSLREIATDITQLISVIIHELVHVIQHKRQSIEGRDQHEYRSYLTKDNDKFRKAMQNITAKKYTPEEYKLYRGSPQEIAAFAQEAAFAFINNLDIDNKIDLVQVRKELPQELPMYIDTMFNKPSNPQEYKVFKRFHKLLYQEIILYLDRLHKNRKKQTKRAAKKVH